MCLRVTREAVARRVATGFKRSEAAGLPAASRLRFQRRGWWRFLRRPPAQIVDCTVSNHRVSHSPLWSAGASLKELIGGAEMSFTGTRLCGHDATGIATTSGHFLIGLGLNLYRCCLRKAARPNPCVGRAPYDLPQRPRTPSMRPPVQVLPRRQTWQHAVHQRSRHAAASSTTAAHSGWPAAPVQSAASPGGDAAAHTRRTGRPAHTRSSRPAPKDCCWA